MPFVKRNSKNEIEGLYSKIQPGIAEEVLEDNDSEVVEFRKGPYWERRQKEYPDVGVQLDAIWKFIESLPGNKPQEVSDVMTEITTIKTRHPKLKVPK